VDAAQVDAGTAGVAEVTPRRAWTWVNRSGRRSDA